MSVANHAITGTPERFPFYSVNADVADQGDKTEAGSAAYYINKINQESTAAKRKGAVILPSGVLTCPTKIKIQDNISLLGQGAGVTVLNFTDNDGGIEVSNADIHATSRVNAVGDYVYPSTIAWPHAVRFRCTTAGTSGTAAAFDILAAANTDVGDTFTEVGGVSWEAVANVTPFVGEFTYDMVSTMTGAGVRASRCNGVQFGNFKATGGNATAASHNVAMQIDSCNQWGIGKLNFEIACHGLLVNVEDVTVLPYNFGDGYAENIDITLSGTSTYAVKFLASSTTADTINNVLINRMEIIGSGDAADCQVAIWLEGAQRNTFKHVDVELCTVAIMELGTSTLRCQDNTFEQIHLINSGAQDTEEYAWARGLPFSQNCTTPYTTVSVRDAWLNFEPFASYDTLTTGYIADDDGTYGRNVTVIGTPSGGYTPLTIASAIPASGRDSIARHPVLTPNTNHAINTKLVFGSSADDGVMQITGDELIFGVNTAHNYISPIIKRNSSTSVDLRSVRDTAGLVAMDNRGFINLIPLAAAPAGVVAGSMAISDGTGSGFDGASGAGLYRYTGAAWTFIG